MFWQKEKECMSKEELVHLQSTRLHKTIDRVYHNVPFYRTKMQNLNLKPDDVKNIDDITKLPFTLKKDLRDHYPLSLFATPMSEIVRVHATSGTTGKPVVVGYTKRDIEIWKQCISRAAKMAGLDSSDVLQVAYGYGLFTGGLGLNFGAKELGLKIIPVGSENADKQIEAMIATKATAIAATPSYLAHLAEVINQKNLLNKINLKVAICGGEPWTEIMRKNLENDLKIKAYDIYGLCEILGPGVASECICQSGMHINEDHFIPEIINPVTLERVEHGVVGELVITTITKEGFPLIRYRTGDLTSIDYKTCECGRTFSRVARMKGRADDMMIIRGVNVYPSQIEIALEKLGYKRPIFHIIVDRIKNKDTFDITFELDVVSDSDSIEHETKITNGIKDIIGVKPKINIVPPYSLQRTTGKAKKATDKRLFINK